MCRHPSAKLPSSAFAGAMLLSLLSNPFPRESDTPLPLKSPYRAVASRTSSRRRTTKQQLHPPHCWQCMQRQSSGLIHELETPPPPTRASAIRVTAQFRLTIVASNRAAYRMYSCAAFSHGLRLPGSQHDGEGCQTFVYSATSCFLLQRLTVSRRQLIPNNNENDLTAISKHALWLR